MTQPGPRSNRITAVAATLLLLLPDAAGAQAGQPTGVAAFDSAFYAWERGDYPDALRRAAALLDGPDPHQHVMPIALMTGELYVTTELTPDGRLPRWAPDSRHVAWETGAEPATVTRIAALGPDGVRAITTVRGRGVQLDAAGNAVYMREARPGSAASVISRDLRTDRERILDVGDLEVRSILLHPGDGVVHVLAGDGAAAHVYALGDGAPRRVTAVTGPKTDPVWLADGRLLYVVDRQTFAIEDARAATIQEGAQVTASADGSTVAFVREDEGTFTISVLRVGADPESAVTADHPLAAPALSPDGRRLAYQAMPREDWDLYVVDAAGGAPLRVTRDVQHDLMPQFLDNDRTLLAVIGEGRHRRSYVYTLPPRDLEAGALASTAPERTRLFHGNSVRTVAPEYEWLPSPDRSKVLIVAERDGDTVSPERGVYVLDLGSRVTVDDVRARVRRQLADEQRLREHGRVLFAGLEQRVRQAVDDVSKDRAYRYSHDLYQFDSKYITQPGNAKAIDYLVAKLREFGYEPELQWFDPRPRGSGTTVRTANVIAKLPGTVHPDVLYTVSSHFDSVERGSGADDDTSGTAALLEAARVLAGRPQPATIHFAFFTGEEAGLLGSREYVRRAVAAGDGLVGALNNDMIGYANDQRLDNTIRYSNAGIRDVQHAAAFLFTDLITYDAKYYKSTDAHAYYEAYGDIVGGIGS
ncbi:MAG: M20/M25/M40 family metallo-hydrolase, partial [Gemmatimonadota bacterium]